MCVSEINFEYWSDKNFAYNGAVLTPTIRVGLVYFAGANERLPDIIEGLDTLTNADLVDKIKKEIASAAGQYWEHGLEEGTKEDMAYLRIFDLIQGWGGRTGRNPYAQPKGAVARDQWGGYHGWLAHYKKGATRALTGNRQDALNSLKNIPQVGESFATKHLYFWGLGGGHHFPIYDTRMKTLLFFDEPQGASYDRYLQKLAELAARQKNTNAVTVEKALFAFSSNYFPNGTLVLNEGCADNTDLAYAEALARAYRKRQPVAQR